MGWQTTLVHRGHRAIVIRQPPDADITDPFWGYHARWTSSC